MQNLSIGIDIGGTNSSLGLVDRRGHIVLEGKISTTGHATFDDYVAALHTALTPLIEKGGVQVAGIGVGAPNANFYTGSIEHAPNLPWKGVLPLGKMLADATHLKVCVTNDANAATIGEMEFGAAKGMKDFIMVTLGTGVGSGFVSNGQLIYGHDGFAGELGHVTAVRDGRICGCGRHGCLETYTSATGIVRTANEWLGKRDTPSILRENAGQISAQNIFEAAEKNDALALEIFDFTAKILGQTLADAVAITSPQAIIFFGGLARSGDFLLKPTKKYLEENLLFVYKNKVELLQSGLPGADAAILGASALVW